MKPAKELLALKFGGKSVAENLQDAIQSEKLIENADGTLQLAARPEGRGNWVYVKNGPALGCGFLMEFLFKNIYARAAVPQGCSNCYKVKVVLRTLRQLVAAWEIAEGIACQSKWGLDLNNPYSQNVYAGYFYTPGLDGARAMHKVVRDLFAADPKIGSDVAMTIKRGCSEYEIAVGPSDSYTFTPEMAELESYLLSRFKEQERADKGHVVLADWIDAAYRMGDDTYLDFTRGRRRRAKTLTYDP
jgi:hypothetical protein